MPFVRHVRELRMSATALIYLWEKLRTELRALHDASSELGAELVHAVVEGHDGLALVLLEERHALDPSIAVRRAESRRLVENAREVMQAAAATDGVSAVDASGSLGAMCIESAESEAAWDPDVRGESFPDALARIRSDAGTDTARAELDALKRRLRGPGGGSGGAPATKG